MTLFKIKTADCLAAFASLQVSLHFIRIDVKESANSSYLFLKLAAN